MRSKRTTTAILAAIAFVVLAIGAFTYHPPSGTADASGQPERVTTTTADPGPTAAEVDTLNRKILQNELDRQQVLRAVWINNTNRKLWIDRTNAMVAAEAARARKIREYEAPANVNTPGTGRCGGNLPPCCVMNRESGGSLTAKNPTSSASGKWQFIDSTWGGYGGYAHASDAPESVQDARAAQLWAGGAGAGHWGGGC